MFKATIYVTLKESVLDPQGTAVKGTLQTLGYSEVTEVRIGKKIEVWLEESSRIEAERKMNELSYKVLSNPVIEDYSFELEEMACAGL